MDTSDISLEEPGSADSSLEVIFSPLSSHKPLTNLQKVSGFLLAKDLRQSKSAVYSTAPSTPSMAVGGNEEVEERMKDNKENRAGQEEKEEKSPSKLSISVSSTPGRRPLEEMAVDGGVVTYCPRFVAIILSCWISEVIFHIMQVGDRRHSCKPKDGLHPLEECRHKGLPH